MSRMRLSKTGIGGVKKLKSCDLRIIGSSGTQTFVTEKNTLIQRGFTNGTSDFSEICPIFKEGVERELVAAIKTSSTLSTSGQYGVFLGLEKFK